MIGIKDKKKIHKHSWLYVALWIVLLIPTFAFAVKAEAEEQNTLIQPVLDTDAAYLAEFEISNTIDGTENFDTSDNPDDPCYKNRIGNDENGKNGKVRTFDEITYNLKYRTEVTNETYYEKGTIQFEFILPLTSKEAVWNTTAMSWMDYGWKVVTEDRTYDFNKDGVKETQSCQILKGKKMLVRSETNPTAIPGQGTLMAVVKVKAMKNGDSVSPVLTAWMEYNRAGNIELGENKVHPTESEEVCEEHSRREQITVQAEETKVTAQPRYNVQLKQGVESYNQHIGGTYDFDEGNEKALDKGIGKVTGTTMGYGVTLQLYNDKGKDLKGIELPDGPITFDLELFTTFVPANATLSNEQKEYVSKNYEPVVLTLGPHVTNGQTSDGRNIAGNTSYIVSGGPENRALNWPYEGSNTCYQGGNWNAVKKKNIISVTVSDYEIDAEKFPNADLGTSHVTNTYFDYKKGVENIGCFSAGMIYILTPSYNNGTTNPEKKDVQILKDLNVSDGSFQTTIKDVNLQAQSVSGQKVNTVKDNSNQMKMTDDAITSTVYLSRPGDHTYRIQYSAADGCGGETESDPLGRRYPVKYGNWGNGMDALVRGHKCSIMNGFLNIENGDMNNRMYAANVLTKFDADAIHLSGKSSVGTWVKAANFESTVLYAAKADGKNWNSDKEMLSAKMEELRYFRSLSELEEAGYRCVGAMTEYRPLDGDYKNIRKVLQGAMLYSQIEGTVSKDAIPGNVYQTVLAAKSWCGKDYIDAAEVGIPSMIENNPDNPVSLPKATCTEYRPYEKARYDESGYAGGHTGDYNYGDSLYILDTALMIKKHVEQVENGNVKSIYHVSDGQRYVDYVLTPEFDEISKKQAINTTVTVTDILPEKLSYVPGSSYFNGTYIQNEEVGNAGKVIDGSPVEPEVKQNKDGTVSLIWKFTNVNSEDALPKIHYSAQIGMPGDHDHDVKNNEEIVNTVRIRGENDRRDYNESLGNEAKTGIRISKLDRSSPSKIPDQRFHDPADSVRYTINVGNNSSNIMEKQLIMDTLPINGDDRGNAFDGTLKMEALKIDPEKIGNLDSWNCYYTESEYVKNTTAKDYSYEDVLNDQSSMINGKNISWQKARIDSSGEIAAVNGKSPTAIMWLGDLQGEKTLSVSCRLKIEGARGGNVIINGVSHEKDATAKPKVYFVDRTISGVAWLDENENGQREPQEKMLGGIRVYLLKKEDSGLYKTVKGADGQAVYTETSKKDGAYCFKNLPAGEYGVQFASGSLNLDKFVPTKENIGDDATDSDGIEIQGLVLPKSEDMLVAHFESRYNDSGFSYKKGKVTIEKLNAKDIGLKGAKFKLEQKQEDGTWKKVEEAETDGKGITQMENLPYGRYRLTELETVNGYSLLKEPIEIAIPYVSEDKGDAEPSYVEEGKYYYLELSYKIKNDRVFTMPDSGKKESVKWNQLGILLVFCGLGYAIYVRKRCLHNNDENGEKI